MHGAGPEGSPGAGGCPGRAGKGREGSRVLSNAATDVLHEGAEAQGGTAEDRLRLLLLVALRRSLQPGRRAFPRREAEL